ncbi:MAG: prepilin peptidase [Clostridia bacterium]|nr:prepilin peptidase [Clostridia bacterium]MBR3817644.1 prepilin peptidase [Clostridia bacterium]
MVEIVYGGLLGILAALAFNRIAIFQIKRRTDENAKIEAVGNTAVIVAWVILSGTLFAAAFAIFKNTAARLEAIAYISIAISIGIVDLDIKKIPNSSVLALLIIRTVSIIYAIVTGVPVKETLIPSLIGLAAGFILYQLPMLIGIPIGTGDVKYSAAIGYCLGAFGYLQASLIMAAGLIVYLIYLVVTKKGSLKTAVPMGPYLSLGVMATVLYPVFGELSDKIFSQLF